MSQPDQTDAPKPILSGLRVLDLAHQYSGALAAGLLADLGADVIAVEHPTKSPIRTMLPRKGDDSLWWKVIQRGKRLITLNINTPQGRELVLELARQVDVITENFRPGTLERWGLGPADLEAAGIDVVMMRISGFGQTGPESSRPGFGTIAEAISGFAQLNGEPDGPPTFPSTTLADGVAATFGAFGIMAALYGRAKGTAPKGVEVVDMALFEGLLRIIPTQIAAYDQLGEVPVRPGNKLTSHGVLRNLFHSRDGRWFVISAVGSAVVRRVMLAADAPEMVARVEAGVMENAPQAEVIAFLDECDALLTEWAAAHDYATLAAKLQAADATFQPVYAANDIVADEHIRAREDLIEVPDPVHGPILMQGVVPKFPRRAHPVSHAGRDRGTDNVEIFRDLLGLDEEALKELQDDGIV
jgi:crotonobetainyl-CoA:carnitine CoA-transferase CaiB-like acyl-CoA transferase